MSNTRSVLRSASGSFVTNRFWQPFQQPQGGGVPATSDYRWPYSASYQLAPAWYDEGQTDWTSIDIGRSSPIGHANVITPSNVVLRGLHLSRAVFPSQKVLSHDYADWYHAQQPYFYASFRDEPKQRISVLLADGAAGARSTADANPGWNPLSPSQPHSAKFVYQPRDWEPPTATGNSAEAIYAGYYRWTRGGLKGRDFGGPEINTGQR